MADMMALNAVFEIAMSGGFAKMETQQTIAFPSQSRMSHRVLVTPNGLYAAELGACAIVHLQAASSPTAKVPTRWSLWVVWVPSARYRWP